MVMDKSGKDEASASTVEPVESPVVCITFSKIIDGEEQIFINVDAVKEVLMQDDIVDLPVAIYSIAGPLRSGKSFLLNLLMRHIKRSKRNTFDLENDEKELITHEFQWKGGMAPHTRGIYILKQPYLVDIDETTHEKAALFLMDTQGIFDMNLAESEHRLIGAFSFVMSSMQLFNLKNQIESAHLDHVYRFIKLAEEIKDKTKCCSLIQSQSLMFLIRDWIMEDFLPGFSGGEEYLKSVLKGENSRALEHKLKETFFKNTFGDIPCFLLPPPEQVIQRLGKASKPVFVKDIGQEFLSKTEELFQHLLAADKLVLKKLNGKQVTCSQFSDFLSDLIPILNKKDLEKNVLHFILVEAIHQFRAVVYENQKKFEMELWKKLSVEPYDEIRYKVIYESVRARTLEQYKCSEKPDIPNFDKKFENGFGLLLDNIFEAYKHCRKAEESYEEHMKTFKDKVGFLLWSVFQKKAKKRLEAAIEKLKKEIHEEISDQCADYFLEEGEKFLQETRDRQYDNAKNIAFAGISLGGAILTAAIPLIAVPVVGVVGTFVAIGGATVGLITAGAGMGSAIAAATADELMELLYNDSRIKDMKMRIKTKIKVALKMGKVYYKIKVDF